jgi:uncharacterized repeat protein (TIGR04138 family)
MDDFESLLQPLLQRDTRYTREAYHFVREALDHTHRLLIRRGEKVPRHVSGQELLDGIRDYALEQFGPMTLTVLEEWGIHCCEDFGHIVFNLVEQRILAKTDNDTLEDFKGGYTFEEAFRKPFLPQTQRGTATSITDEA